jgi:ribosomal protein L37AE/L43A
MSLHILQVPYVVSHVSKRLSVGRGKHRAWCDKCGQLKDRKTFRWVVYSPHPESHTGLYYGPYGSWLCNDCATKEKADKWMGKREYNKLFKRFIKEQPE